MSLIIKWFSIISRTFIGSGWGSYLSAEVLSVHYRALANWAACRIGEEVKGKILINLIEIIFPIIKYRICFVKYCCYNKGCFHIIYFNQDIITLSSKFISYAHIFIWICKTNIYFTFQYLFDHNFRLHLIKFISKLDPF